MDHKRGRNTWRLSSTLCYRYYSQTGQCFFIRTGKYGIKTRATTENTIRVMIENQGRITYGLTKNRDTYFNRTVEGGGTVGTGFDRYRVQWLYVSSGARYQSSGSLVVFSQYEYATFLEKSSSIISKMGVSVSCYIIICMIPFLSLFGYIQTVNMYTLFQ